MTTVHEVVLPTQDVNADDVISVCFEWAGKFVPSKDLKVPNSLRSSKTVTLKVQDTLSLMTNMGRNQNQDYSSKKDAKLIVRKNSKLPDGTDRYVGIAITNISLQCLGQSETQPLTHCSPGGTVSYWISSEVSSSSFSHMHSDEGYETSGGFETDGTDGMSIASWDSENDGITDVLAADFDTGSMTDEVLLAWYELLV